MYFEKCPAYLIHLQRTIIALLSIRDIAITSVRTITRTCRLLSIVVTSSFLWAEQLPKL